ncbi:MAG: hypothetical protein KJO19_09990 [Woeseia sp.]|nr:hypothetical protein [Woeseia sp.]
MQSSAPPTKLPATTFRAPFLIAGERRRQGNPMHPIRLTLLICCLAIGAQPGPSWAAVRDVDRAAVVSLAQQNGPSLSEAVERVRRQYRGRIVSASTQMRGNREIHVIKVLTEDGKVKTVRIAGRTRGNRA